MSKINDIKKVIREIGNKGASKELYDECLILNKITDEKERAERIEAQGGQFVIPCLFSLLFLMENDGQFRKIARTVRNDIIDKASVETANLGITFLANVLLQEENFNIRDKTVEEVLEIIADATTNALLDEKIRNHAKASYAMILGVNKEELAETKGG